MANPAIHQIIDVILPPQSVGRRGQAVKKNPAAETYSKIDGILTLIDEVLAS